jgi:uncharacterized protein with PQ loop repeat
MSDLKRKILKRGTALAGVIGATCFSISGIPQMILSIQTGNSDGMSAGTIWLWLGGEFSMTIFAIASTYIGDIKHKAAIILLANYLLCMATVAVIAWYKYFPR